MLEETKLNNAFEAHCNMLDKNNVYKKMRSCEKVIDNCNELVDEKMI